MRGAAEVKGALVQCQKGHIGLERTRSILCAEYASGKSLAAWLR